MYNLPPFCKLVLFLENPVCILKSNHKYPVPNMGSKVRFQFKHLEEGFVFNLT